MDNNKDNDDNKKSKLVAVAVKHPGVFVETRELEQETGQKLPQAPLLSKPDAEEPQKPKAEPEKPEAESEKPEAESQKPEAESQKPESETEEAKSEAKPEALRLPPELGEKPEEQNETEVTTTEKSGIEVTLERMDVDRNDDESMTSKIETRSRKREEEARNEIEDSASAEEEDGEDSAASSTVEEDGDSLASGSTLRIAAKRANNKNRRKAGPTTGKAKGGGGNRKGTLAKSKRKVASSNTRGKGRRFIFKKSAIKAPAAVARAITSNRVYYKGQYFTKGDIVSVTDIDGGIYYGQLRGFLTDQYCEKSGVISWLLPTANSPSPESGFDPATYVIGPEEELPRKLNFFTFVSHAPDDYFYYKNAPYPTDKIETDQEYVIGRLGPKIRLVKDGKPYYKSI